MTERGWEVVGKGGVAPSSSVGRLEGSARQLGEVEHLAQVGSWEWDIAANRVTWSDELFRIYGYEPQSFDVTYELFLDHVHAGDRDRVDRVVRSAYSSGDAFEFEHRIVRPDGVRILHARGQVIVGADGQATHMRGTGQDITERKRTEAALRESEEQFRKVFEEGPLGMVLVGDDLRFIEVNDAVCRMAGYSRNELVGRSFLELIDPADVGIEADAADQLFRGEIPSYRAEKRYLTKRGEQIWVNLTATLIRDETGRPVHGLGIIEDITERKRTEAALRDSEERFRSLLEAAPDGMIGVDSSGRIGMVNRQAEVLFGYDREELIGSSIEMLIPERFRDVHPGHRASYAEDPRTRPMAAGLELAARRRDGTEFPVDISLSTVGAGASQMITAAVRDVTDRREAEEEVRWALAVEREASERLRRLDDMKDTFLRAVSHDLRTPLSVIVWLSQALAQDGLDLSAEQSRDLVRRIEANARALDRLVLDLLDLDRLSTGAGELAREPADIGALVRGVVERSEVLGERPLMVQVEEIEIPVDQGKIERMVENLLANVSRHTPADAGVWVRVGPDGNGALIVVEDSGPGVPHELREAIFQPFQVGIPRRDTAGIGVGLSLVQKLAQLHGGRAWLEDRSEGGASFRVWLPGRRVLARSS